MVLTFINYYSFHSCSANKSLNGCVFVTASLCDLEVEQAQPYP